MVLFNLCRSLGPCCSSQLVTLTPLPLAYLLSAAHPVGSRQCSRCRCPHHTLHHCLNLQHSKHNMRLILDALSILDGVFELPPRET